MVCTRTKRSKGTKPIRRGRKGRFEGCHFGLGPSPIPQTQSKTEGEGGSLDGKAGCEMDKRPLEDSYRGGMEDRLLQGTILIAFLRQKNPRGLAVNLNTMLGIPLGKNSGFQMRDN